MPKKKSNNGIPENIQKIALRQAANFYYSYWWKLHRFCDYEDIVQIIYERLWKDDLWTCNDKSLIYICSKRACIDYIRQVIYKFGKKEHDQFDLIEFEDQLVHIFDSHYYEIMSLNQLLEKLPKMKRFIAKRIIENYTLDEIGEMIELTGSRISQLRSEIVSRLIELCKNEFRNQVRKKSNENR